MPSVGEVAIEIALDEARRGVFETTTTTGDRDSLVTYNGCSTDTKPVHPSPCVAYQGCMPGYPMVWCVSPGDPHAIPSFAAGAIATFFQQF